MLSIRKGCFETNSSSMHSLAIWKKVKPYSDYELSLGTLYDSDKEIFNLLDDCNDESDYIFERCPYRQLITPIQKLRYVVGLFITYRYPNNNYKKKPEYYWTDDKVKKEITQLIKKYTKCKKIKFYKESWSSKEKIYPSTSVYNDSGDNVLDFIKRKNISLEDLIFKPNYTIQVDGDEYKSFKIMFKYNMINLDNLEDISSGVDFWTDNMYNFFVENTLNQDFGIDHKPYLEVAKEIIVPGMSINVYSYFNIEDDIKSIEEYFKATGEFLSNYKDICKINFKSNFKKYLTKEIKEKYFSWVD